MKDFIFTSSFGHSWHQFPFNKDLEKFALKLEKNFPSIVSSNHNGYHSDYLDIHVPLIKKFYDAIKPAVYDYTKSLNIEKPYVHPDSDRHIGAVPTFGDHIEEAKVKKKNKK